MKKLMVALAFAASIVTVASTDVYEFKTTLKYPAIGKTAFVPATTPVTGTLTITDQGETNETAILDIKLKKANYACIMVAETNTSYEVFGKKTTDVATTISFVNVSDPSNGLIRLTFYGWGTLKTKKTGGCTPCGDTTETCSRWTVLNGVVGGKYICPCGGSFIGWDGACELVTTNGVKDITVYGTNAKFKLKSVNEQKW